MSPSRKANQDNADEFRHMREAELTDFIRDTVVRLETLASRLESLADTPNEGDNGS